MQLIHRFVRYQERVSGVPGRFIAPVVLAGLSLQVAVLGMYWDIGYHIDHGRDQGVFTAPHMFIVVGLQGIVLAALLHGRMRGPGGAQRAPPAAAPEHEPGRDRDARLRRRSRCSASRSTPSGTRSSART